MKAIGFVSGIALGMAAAVAAVSAVYPDIPKRAKRDTTSSPNVVSSSSLESTVLTTRTV